MSSELHDDANPPAKKRRTKKGSVGAEGQSKPRQRQPKLGKLAGIMEMPIDIFSEIAVLLHPLDLLHLARTSRGLRALLMTRTSRFIWTASFAQFEDLPGPPFHLNEPGYAAFLFDPKCQWAGCSGRVLRVDYQMTVRLCKTHYEYSYVNEREALRSLSQVGIATGSYGDYCLPGDEVLESYARVPGANRLSIASGSPGPHSFLEEHDFSRKFKFFKREDIKQLVTKLQSLEVALPALAAKTPEGKQMIEDHKELIKNERERAADTQAWAHHIQQRRVSELDSMRGARMDIISSRLHARGWTNADIYGDIPRPHGHQKFDQIFYKPAPLSEKVWTNALPELESILQIRREERLERLGEAERSRRRKITHQLMASVASRLAKSRKSFPTTGRASVSASSLFGDIARLTGQKPPSSYEYPSLDHLLAADGLEPSLGPVEAIGDDILHQELHELEMRCRESLVQLIRWSGLSLDLWDSETAYSEWKFGRTDLTLDELEARDAENLELLLDPSSIFLVQRASGFCKKCHPNPCAFAYPEVLEHGVHISATKVVSGLRKLRPVAIELSAQLDLGKESIYALNKQSGKTFRCESCPFPEQARRLWKDMVKHVAQERYWHSHLASLEVSPLINSHEVDKTLIKLSSESNAEEYSKALETANKESGERKYKCAVCSSRVGPLIHLVTGHSLVKGGLGVDCVSLRAFPLPQWQILLHMKKVHGWEEVEAGRQIQRVA